MSDMLSLSLSLKTASFGKFKVVEKYEGGKAEKKRLLKAVTNTLREEVERQRQLRIEWEQRCMGALSTRYTVATLQPGG